jgi:hypothetical protein
VGLFLGCRAVVFRAAVSGLAGSQVLFLSPGGDIAGKRPGFSAEGGIRFFLAGRRH